MIAREHRRAPTRHQCTRRDRGELAPQDDRSDRPGVDAVRAAARRRLSAISDCVDPRRRSATPFPTTPSLRGLAAARRRSTPIRSSRTPASASHVIEPTAQIIARPNQRRPAQPAGRGRQEPGVRRHAAVRCRQVLGLRPLRDRHARQRRRAVHVPGQQRRLCARRVRPELSTWPARTLRRSRRSTAARGQSDANSRRSAACRPTGRTTWPASTCRPSGFSLIAQAPLRRERLVAAPAGHAAAASATARSRVASATPTAVRSRPPACSTSSRTSSAASACA